jgi:hypothetical protein
VAAPAVAPVVPVAPAVAVESPAESPAPDEILASVRMYCASADAGALLAPGAGVVPVVPAAVEPAVPVVPVAAVLVAAGVLGLAVFAAEFDGAARRHPVTVTVFSLLAVLGCVDVVCGAGVCAAMTAVAHAAIAAHKLV